MSCVLKAPAYAVAKVAGGGDGSRGKIARLVVFTTRGSIKSLEENLKDPLERYQLN